MKITEEIKKGLGLALNEAVIHGIEFHREKRIVSCTFGVVMMSKDGSIPDENRHLFVFSSIGRLVASLRNGSWNDKNATVEHFEPDKLLEVFNTIGHQTIYGWDFINCGDDRFNSWKDRLSFDYKIEDGIGCANTIDLFQEYGGTKHLDVRLWFDDFEIYTPSYVKVSLKSFIENGKRGWDAIYAGDERMLKYGIVPMRKGDQGKFDELKKKNESRETMSGGYEIIGK
jgi:hypothetical protein